MRTGRTLDTAIATFRIARPWVRTVTIWLVTTVMLALTDAFDVSTTFGSGLALTFWSVLVGVNMAAWLAWRWRIQADGATARQFAIGAVLLNGLLAIEVPLLYQVMGRADAAIGWRPFAYGLLVTVFIAYLRHTVRAKRPASQEHDRGTAAVTVEPINIVTTGILARAGIADPSDLLSVRAEDHYCRLSVRNAGSVLVHYRFKDAVSDLAHLPGAQVHRGAWVADHAVAGGRRDSRRWSLQLTDGTGVPVSETSVALCRTRGWLRPIDGLA